MVEAHAMTSPIRLYLDSSDFSLLSDSVSLDPANKQLLGELRAFAQTGKVQFCFSDVHVYEMAPLSSEYRHHACRRLQLVHDLCGEASFRPAHEILSQEAKALAEGQSKSPWTSENSIWGPWISLHEFVRFAEGWLQDQLRRALGFASDNRQSRRAIRAYLTSGGELASAGIKLIAKRRNTSLPLPTLPFAVSEDWDRLLRGKVSLQRTALRFQDVASDVRTWVDAFGEDRGDGNDWLGQSSFRSYGQYRLGLVEQFRKAASYSTSSGLLQSNSLAQTINGYRDTLLTNVSSPDVLWQG